MQGKCNICSPQPSSPRASDLLLSVPNAKRQHTPPSPAADPFSTSTPARSKSPLTANPFADSPAPAQSRGAAIPLTPLRHPHAPTLIPRTENTGVLGLDYEAQEQDTLIAARECVESKEFHRGAHLLRNCQSPKARFLRVYCQFIVSQSEYFRALSIRITS